MPSMDHQTLITLGEYLNENLNLETCDNTLRNTHAWLEVMMPDQTEAELAWLEAQGVSCDCQVVLKLYIPARENEVCEPPSD